MITQTDEQTAALDAAEAYGMEVRDVRWLDNGTLLAFMRHAEYEPNGYLVYVYSDGSREFI